MLRNCWCEKMSHVFNPSTDARSKWCFCSMSVVSFHSWSNSTSGISFFPVWKSLFLAFLTSVTKESYLFPNFCFITFVYNVTSNLSQFVIPLLGQRISRWSRYWHFKVFSSSYNSFPSVGSFSWINNTLWHRFLPEWSIKIVKRSQFSYSWLKPSIAAAIFTRIDYYVCRISEKNKTEFLFVSCLNFLPVLFQVISICGRSNTNELRENLVLLFVRHKSTSATFKSDKYIAHKKFHFKVPWVFGLTLNFYAVFNIPASI